MSAIAPVLKAVPPELELLERELDHDSDDLPRHVWERALGAPAREFLRRPGKQFRARMVEAAWTLAGGAPSAMPAELPSIVELLHAGSLIVDDIEDAATDRRGAPALHRMVGVPLALNTGNWLYFWPLQMIDSLPIAAHLRAEMSRIAVARLADCHRGQALDLSARVTDLDQGDVPKVVRATTRLKTGALMELAASLGAVAAGANAQRVAALNRFARDLGTGLQMLDDLGGLTSPARAHKGVEDLMHARPTWPWAWVAAASAPDAFAALQSAAGDVVAGRGDAGALAAELAAAVAEPGRQRVHARLHLSVADLESTLGQNAVTRALRDTITRLEKSYG